ncbi:hypothetical protein PanWU01x14_252350 [Parasponia andersonii]|uniref:Uncharacterized protein n=1 Tax=Parasponia andersonii TaxID=3476 RepID=A0A2P5BC39_PARAD|nr:hypothetical protein PanWU01x14_252350 [Parasponia andersonii]
MECPGGTGTAAAATSLEETTGVEPTGFCTKKKKRKQKQY